MTSSISRLDVELATWWKSLGHDPADDKQVHRVGELLPNGYDAYRRLFHPFRPWDSDPRSVTATQLTPWSSLAAAAGVEFGGQITWRQLEPVLPLVEGGGRRLAVDEGYLIRPVRQRLCSTLGAATPTQIVFVSFGPDWFMKDRERVTFKSSGDLNTTIDATADEVGRISPELAWSEDHSWVFCSDIDLTSTYIACDQAVAAQLDATEGLELAAVSLRTRIDNRADEGN